MFARVKRFASLAKSSSPATARPVVALPTSEQQAAVIARVEACYQQAEQQLDRVFTRPSINFKLRGKAAGTAHPVTQQLRFNAVLLEENPQHFLTDVVPHEVCHLLTAQLFGRVKPHGHEWKGLMQQVFGLSGDVTHQLDVSSVTPKGIAYHCRCGTVELSIRRHNKVVRQQAQYLCRRCGEQLTKT
ncbi:SprT family zinc-dependent metalloprotease [Shewanella sp. C32]|uniref:SprT family zinc-dependent metalloprotease n=1 Tax=Shewanella electrica TaxID=515560 RepID=A0ABT2FNI5_9GAMM|nr:SprT family zinc-dependent metalloprotease [Shewanella electrica]MCH1925503.1 SprT family zinc-dependent metalloprotease [Shewanella electrica]MCS4557190.1 SprT family zinc-dependent metalloprotease [Shewanella electrica]